MGERRKKSKTRNPRPADPGFGSRLCLAMARRGIKPGELARRMPAAGQSVSRWRKGEWPEAVRLARMADVLSVSLNWLTTGQGAMDAPTNGADVQSPPDGAHGGARLRRVIGRLELALEDLRDLAGGVPPLTFEEAERAAGEAGAVSLPAGNAHRRAGP